LPAHLARTPISAPHRARPPRDLLPHRAAGSALITSTPPLETRQVKDGFGLPLEPSEAFFFTSDPSPAMYGPQVSAAGSSLIVLEPSPDGAPLPWPVVSRGAPRWSSDPTGVQAWPLGVSNYLTALDATTTYDDSVPPAKLGTASEPGRGRLTACGRRGDGSGVAAAAGLASLAVGWG
jgi:hypothetical protein